MHKLTLSLLRLIATILLVTGAVLMTINLIGLVDYTTITGNEDTLIVDTPRKVSEAEFWEQAYLRPGEDVTDYAVRLTALINDRMIAIDPAFAVPTLFENWILWLHAQRIGYHEWADTRRAVRLGGGYCSQHAIVMDNLLDEQGIESRIIGLGGHVLNEVQVDGHWRVMDSNYNVVFNHSLAELETNPILVYQTYLASGLSEGTARNWEQVFGTTEDNWHFRNSLTYKSFPYFLFEKLSLKLIWLIPVLLLITGAILYLWIRHSDDKDEKGGGVARG